LNKSAIIQKISLAQAAAVSNLKNATGKVEVITVGSNASVKVINPNGASWQTERNALTSTDNVKAEPITSHSSFGLETDRVTMDRHQCTS